MKLKARFSLIAGGITIFLILAPILVFYARGFKYDFSTGQIIKTGTMVVRTEPKAKVFLDSDTKGADTPASIRFLLPKDYTIRIEKEEYQSWIKRLRVTEQFVTWASVNRDKIHLFLKKPELISAIGQTSAFISSDSAEIAVATAGQEHLIKVDSGFRENLGLTNSVKLPLPDQAEIHWTQGAQIWQLLQTANAWPIDQAAIDAVKQVHTNGKQTAILSAAKLYSFDVAAIDLIDDNVSGATLHDSELWYVTGDELKIYDFSAKSSKVIATDLPMASESKIIRAGNQIYLIIAGQLYHLRDKAENIYGPVTFARWHEDAGKLLYGNDNEAYLHDPLTDRSELALRSLTPIDQVQLNWITGYMFYANEGKIKAAELDTRNGQNQFDILEFAGNSRFLVAPEGDRAYIVNATEILEYQIR